MEKKRRREFVVLFLLVFAVHIFMEIDFNDDQVYTGIIRKKDSCSKGGLQYNLVLMHKKKGIVTELLQKSVKTL